MGVRWRRRLATPFRSESGSLISARQPRDSSFPTVIQQKELPGARDPVSGTSSELGQLTAKSSSIPEFGQQHGDYPVEVACEGNQAFPGLRLTFHEHFLPGSLLFQGRLLGISSHAVLAISSE